MTSIYLIGSLRQPHIRKIAKMLRDAGHEVFDDWHAVGPAADDEWQQYEKDRGRTYNEALSGRHAQHAFALDNEHLHRCQVGVLVLPAGKSGHMELGFLLGQQKPGYILMDGEPDRFDLMYLLATRICLNPQELLDALSE